MDLTKKEWTKYLLIHYKTISDLCFHQIKDNVDWGFLNSQNLPCSFLEKYLFELDVEQVCKNSYLSDEFLIQQKDWLDWVTIIEVKGKSLSKRVKEECKENILMIYHSIN